MEYEVTDPKTGKTIVLKGDHAPTQADADEAFQMLNARATNKSPQGYPLNNGQMVGIKGPDIPKEEEVGITGQIAQGIIKPFVNTASNVVGAGTEWYKKSKMDSMDKLGSSTLAKANAISQQLKVEKNPENKKALAGQLKGLDEILSKLHTEYQGLQQPNALIDGKDFSNGIASKGLQKQLGDSASIASWAVPFGKGSNIFTKAIAPGATVGVAQQASQGETPLDSSLEDYLKAGLTGAGTAGVFNILGKGFNKIKQPIASKLESGAKTATTKGLKPSPSQYAKFEKETGEPLDKFLVDRKMAGADANKIVEHTAKLQENFDDIVLNSNLKVDKSGIIGGFTKKIDELNKSTLPVDKAKAKVLDDIMTSFSEKYKGKTLTAKELTYLKYDIDQAVKSFTFDEASKGPMQIYRDIIQQSIRNSADKKGINVGGKSLKQLGNELRKFYKLSEIAEKQSALGKGSMPLNLNRLLGMAVGNMAGLPGMIAGGVATGIINSPVTSRLVAKGLYHASNKVANQKGNVMHPLLNNLVNQGLIRGQVINNFKILDYQK